MSDDYQPQHDSGEVKTGEAYPVYIPLHANDDAWVWE